MKLPSWDELKGEKLAIIDHPLDQSMLVVGPPGSGKTLLALHRTERLKGAGRERRVITYNKMLCRLVELHDETGADVMTMHRFVGIDYKRRTGSELNSFNHNWTQMITTVQHQPFHSAKRYHLVVDEGQDIEPGFYEYASACSTRTLSIFADEHQNLDEEKGSKWEQIHKAAGEPKAFVLKENHRNTAEIAKVAEHFHEGKVPPAVLKRGFSGQRPWLWLSPDLKNTAQRIANWFGTNGGNVGVVVDLNSTGNEIHRLLQAHLPEARVDIYASGSSDASSINLLDDGITVMNVKSVKGQEFDTLFLLELERFIPCRTAVMRRVMYMVCARARDHLWLISGFNPLSAAAVAALPGDDLLERL